MPTPAQLIPVCYYPNSVDWFLQIRHLPRPVWLDSGHPGSNYGRFDILSAAPALSFTTIGPVTTIQVGNTSEETPIESTENPFELLARYLPINHRHLPETPFVGGALGYFAYDLGRRLESLPEIASRDLELPDMCLGIYPWALVQDHHQQQAWLVINKALAPAYNFSEIESLTCETDNNPRFHDLKQNLKSNIKPLKINDFERNLKVSEYRLAIDKIQAYIAAGDCYQVNFAQRFSSGFEGDTLTAYLLLRDVLPSPFSAYMELPQGAVLSLSPERFIQLNGKAVETKPIKGTIARGATPEEDQANANRLAASLKDRAENLMIVDLLRNDLSKTCNDGRVP